MIIECINCNKKFNVNSNDIPEKGRLLLCTNCNHKWFFKKETINKPIKTTKIIEPIKETTVFNEEFKPSDVFKLFEGGLEEQGFYPRKRLLLSKNRWQKGLTPEEIEKYKYIFEDSDMQNKLFF